MANKKFSQFNQLSTPSANTEVVGFDGTNNVRLPASSLRGYEPFERDSLIYPRQINGAFPFDDLVRFNATTSLTSTANNACPFWVQQKVNITRFRVSAGSGNAALCLYKYTSETQSSGQFFLMDFTLVSQSPVLNFPTTGTQFQTLSTPLTVEPGSVYIAILLPVSGTTMAASGISSRGIIAGQVKLAQSNAFLGLANSYLTRFSGLQLASSPAAVITGGVAPSTLRFVTQQPEAQLVDYLQIGLLNI